MHLDPGFGNMPLQAIVLLAAVGGAILFSARKKIRNLFTRNNPDSQHNFDPPAQHESDDDDAVDVLDD